MGTKRLIPALVLLALAAGTSNRASSPASGVEPGALLDSPQYSDWSAALNVGWPVNTTALDGCPFISKDGLELFFASNRATGSGPTDLYVSQRQDRISPWADPLWMGSDINTPQAEEFCPTLTISGRYLFFVSNRSGGCGGNDIYVSRRLDKNEATGWGPPENLGCQLNSPQSDITPSLFEDADGSLHLYFSSNRPAVCDPGACGGMDIYVSSLQPDGTFGAPVLAAGLNTAVNDQRPNIRVRDGLEIFFESNRSGSLNGSLDIWVATRTTTADLWSSPTNLGPLVNSSAVDGRASLSFDGTELYFMSNRPGGFGDQDIYVATRTRLRGFPR